MHSCAHVDPSNEYLSLTTNQIDHTTDSLYKNNMHLIDFRCGMRLNTHTHFTGTFNSMATTYLCAYKKIKRYIFYFYFSLNHRVI